MQKLTAKDGRKYMQFTTEELLRYVDEQVSNPDGSTVEAVIYNGEIKCTHFFDCYDDTLYTHDGIDGENEVLTNHEILTRYAHTTWIVWCEEDE